jgi:hypothetical protein
LAAIDLAQSGALPEASPGAVFAARTPPDSVTTRAFQRKRYGTLVVGIIATLSGFALTAYFLAQGGASQSTAKDAPSATRPALPVVTTSSSQPIVTPATSALPAQPAPPTHAPSGDKSRRPAPPKPSAHVAGGLQLSTKEP